MPETQVISAILSPDKVQETGPDYLGDSTLELEGRDHAADRAHSQLEQPFVTLIRSDNPFLTALTNLTHSRQLLPNVSDSI